MTLQKNNIYKEYVLELKQIKYNHVQDNRTPPLQRQFWNWGLLWISAGCCILITSWSHRRPSFHPQYVRDIHLQV
jgi:hypothetical protein